MITINTNIRLGKNVAIYPHVMFFGNGPIEIGDNVSIGNDTIIASLSKEGIKIGSNTLIATMELSVGILYENKNT